MKLIRLATLTSLTFFALTVASQALVAFTGYETIKEDWEVPYIQTVKDSTIVRGQVLHVQRIYLFTTTINLKHIHKSN